MISLIVCVVALVERVLGLLLGSRVKKLFIDVCLELGTGECYHESPFLGLVCDSLSGSSHLGNFQRPALYPWRFWFSSLKPWIRNFFKCPGDSVVQPLVLKTVSLKHKPMWGAQEVFSSVCVKFVIKGGIQVGREKLARSWGWRPGDYFNQHSITSCNPKNELLSLSREMKIQGRPGLEACLACLRQFLCSVEILRRYGWSP